MKLWGYYALHTFLNTIKKMFRSTFLIVILACVGFGVIFGLVGGIVGSVVEQNSTEVSTEAITDDNGDFKEDAQGKEEHMSPEDAALVKTCIEGVVALVFLAILLWGMYTGSKNGTDIFSAKLSAAEITAMVEESLTEVTSRIYIRTGDLIAIELSPVSYLATRTEGNFGISGTLDGHPFMSFNVHNI